MALVPPHFALDLESVKFQARTKLAEIGDEIVASRRLDSRSSQELFIKLTKIRLLLKALDVTYIDKEQKERIAYILIKVSGIYDFPTAPVLSAQARPAILIGDGGGTTVVNNTFSEGVDAESTDIDTTTVTVDSFAVSLAKGARWDYVATDGTNYRAGTVVATWDGTDVVGSEVTSGELGDTSDVTIDVDIDSGTVRFRATTTSDNWNVHVTRYFIYG